MTRDGGGDGAISKVVVTSIVVGGRGMHVCQAGLGQLGCVKELLW